MHPRTRIRSLIFIAVSLATVGAAAVAVAEPSWTRWGGPNGDFSVDGAGLAATWPEAGPPDVWSRELGDGYSAILVEGDRLYTMYRNDQAQEVVLCADAATGETIWEHAYDSSPREGHVTQFGEGPRATPLIVGEHIYTIGIASVMHALDKRTGEVVWTHDLWDEFGGNVLNHGYSSSPIANGDQIITLVGGEDASIVAFDRKDGSVAWKNLSFANSYSTPQIMEIDGRAQLVAFMADHLIGADPTDGSLLWKYAIENEWQQNINLPILATGNILFLSSAQAGARGLRLTAEGDAFDVEEVWTTRKIQFYHVNSVRQGDYVFGSTGTGAPSFLAYVDMTTGAIAWRKRGFSKANVLKVGDRLILLDEDGNLALASASASDFEVHAKAQVLDRVSWTVPTLVDNRLYVRDKTHLTALDLGGVDAEAIAVLKKVDAAVKAVDAVRFHGSTTPSGVAERFRQAAEVEAVMIGFNGSIPEKFWTHVKTSRPGSAEEVELTGGGDGDTFFVVDHTSRKGYEDMDPGVLGSSGPVLSGGVMIEFVHDRPFDDELNADQVKYSGTERVGDATCHKIDVVYSGGRGRSTWYFSIDDYLPRRRIQHFTTPEGEGALDIRVSKLEVDPSVEAGLFKMELPAGYEQIDDFAP